MLFGRGPIEPEFARRNRAIQRKRRARHSPRTQRAQIHPLARIRQPADVALDHADVRQQPMRHQHRLRPLQMRIRRHHRLARRLSDFDQSKRPIAEPGQNREVYLPSHKQPHIRRNLLIAAAPRVQLKRQFPNQFGKLDLYEMVNVFSVRIESNDVRTKTV
jgi:hypothetical protein